MRKKTKITISRVIHAAALVALACYIAYFVWSLFLSISDSNPLVGVVSTLGATSIWCFFLFRLHRNIDHETDNPYGEALSWTAERSARLVVVILLVFMLGATIKKSIETSSYWWVAALAAVILLSKQTRTRHFKEWWRGLRFLYTKALMLDVKDKGPPSTEKADD